MLRKVTETMFLTAFIIVNIFWSTKASVNSFHEPVEFLVNPSEYINGLTTSTDMQCSFQHESTSPAVSVMSIIISFANATDPSVSIYIASVNEREGHAHNISNDVGSISGAINTSGQSFLKISVTNAHSFKDGVYTCEVSGFDENGIPFTVSNSSRTQELNPDIGVLFKELEEMESHLNKLREIVIDLQGKLHSARETYFFSSSVYNGHRFYMAINIDHFIYSEAQATCEMLGGYLVELDSREEQSFVRDFIQTINVNKTYTTIMTGATDEEQEGVWVNKHNRYSSPTFFVWGPGRPTMNRAHNCQYFRKVNSIWYLFDGSCSFYAVYNQNSFICEVSEDAEIISLT